MTQDCDGRVTICLGRLRGKQGKWEEVGKTIWGNMKNMSQEKYGNPPREIECMSDRGQLTVGGIIYY